jgi:hypothetical protein
MGTTKPRAVLGVVLAFALASALAGCHSNNPSPTHGASSPAAAPSPAPDRLCADMSGAWDTKAGRCRVTKDGAGGVHTEAKAVYPADLIDNPTAGPVLGLFVRKFLTDYGQTDANGSGDANLSYSMVSHNPNTKTVVFHADWYFASMPHPVAEITTFTFDLAAGKQLQLADLLCPGLDPLKVIPPIARPFVQQALIGSAFPVERFEPDQPEGELADNYQAWALDADDLVLYLPAARGPGGVPPAFITPRIPLAKFAGILREKGCSPATT